MSQSLDELRAIVPGLFNGGCPMPGLATAGQPSADELAAFAKAGYRAVLDLRMPHEPRGFDEDEVMAASGMRYEKIPLQGAIPDEAFDAVRALVRDPANHPILVHCASANRVGAVLLPYFILDAGKSQGDAVTMAKAVGLRDATLAGFALDYVKRHTPS